jgi:hypothetical protein
MALTPGSHPLATPSPHSRRGGTNSPGYWKSPGSASWRTQSTSVDFVAAGHLAPDSSGDPRPQGITHESGATTR